MKETTSQKGSINWQMGTALVLFATIIIVAIMVLKPNFQDWQSSQNKIEEKKAELQAKEKYFAKLEQVKSSLDENKEEFEKIKSALPDDPYLPSFARYLQEASSGSGVILKEMSSFRVSEPKEDEGKIKEIFVDIDIVGSYTSLKNLITVFENSARIIEVESISLSTGKGSGETGTDEDEEMEPVVLEDGDESFVFKVGLKTHSY